MIKALLSRNSVPESNLASQPQSVFFQPWDGVKSDVKMKKIIERWGQSSIFCIKAFQIRHESFLYVAEKLELIGWYEMNANIIYQYSLLEWKNKNAPNTHPLQMFNFFTFYINLW